MNRGTSAPMLWHHHFGSGTGRFGSVNKWGFGINEPVEVEPLACSSVSHAAVLQNSRVALNCTKVIV